MFFTTLVQVVECGHSVREQTWTADAEAEAVITSCIESATTIPMITIFLTSAYVDSRYACTPCTLHSAMPRAVPHSAACDGLCKSPWPFLHPHESPSEREQSRPAPLRSECACHRECVRVVRRAWAQQVRTLSAGPCSVSRGFPY